MPFFEIKYDPSWDGSGEEGYRWLFRKGSEKNPGEPICDSYAIFDTERETRSDIASTKKTFAAARMAKVVSPKGTA